MYQCHACPDSPSMLGPVCPLFARMDAGAAVRDAEYALERAQADVRYGIRVAEAQETIRRTLEALPALREAREYVLAHAYLPPLPDRGYTPVVF